MKFFLATALFLIACQNNTYKHDNSYRESIDPLGQLFPVSNSNTSQSFKRSYISWYKEHENLVSNIGKSKLAVYESNRRVIGHLTSLMLFMRKKQRYSIESYIKLYNNLIKEGDMRISHRILEKNITL